MIKDIFRRVTAGALSALTLFTAVPLSGATDSGIMPLAEEDNKASAVTIKVGEVYNIADRGVQKAWFQQNGAPRNVWPMYTTASDGTEIRAYCADHSKSNPGTGGMPYTVTGRVDDMHVYGVAAMSDSRMTLNEIISTVGAPLTAENFTADMYFSASQAALWAALGDAQIAANNNFGVNYVSSTSLGYRASGKTLSASTTSEALTLYTAIEMLKYGNDFYAVWGPSGKGHAPWVGATINYTPGNTEYAPAAQKAGTIDVGGSIVSGGTFAEKQIDGQDYMVLPMAAASATFVRGEGEYGQIFVRADNVPDGAFLMDSQGNKSYADGGSQRITLSHVASNKELYKNGNDMAYGETFLFCIPKATAEQMDTASTPLETQFFVSMAVDRYNVYVASTNSSGVQPVTLIFQNTIKKHFGIYKIDEETREPIPGVTFEIWKDGRLLGNYTTDEHGRIWLPYAEPGTYQTKEVVTDPRYVLNEATFTIENNSEYPTFFTIPNTRKKDIIVKKIDLDTGKPMQGVVFEGFKDSKSIGMFTTGPDGTFTIDYADPGTYKFVERHTLAGYELSTVVLEGEHTTDRDLVLTLDNVEQKSFIVKKIDSETKEPLAGVQFKIWRDSVLLGDYTTDENGRIEIKNAPAGTYKVQEVATLKEYILNNEVLEIEHTTAKDTELTVENTKRPGLLIQKIDAETRKPLKDAVFQLKKANGDMVKEDIITGEDGTAFIEGLDAGDYIVTEVTAPGGYVVDDTPHSVSLEEGKTYTLTLENTKKPGLLIKKIDSQTKKPLQGAVFKITRGNGSVVRESVTTDADGVIHLPELDTGTYIITEITAPDGYAIDETPKTVEIRAGQTYEVTFTNTKKGGFTIKKIDEDTRQPLKNAVFKITKSNGEFVKEAETDANGVITLDGLTEGSYIVTEIKAPDGYILQDTPKTFEIKDGGSMELVFTNKKAYGLQIRKIVKDTGEALPGAKFRVEKATGELIGEYTSNSSGLVTISGLDDGVYVVTEIKAPDGYRLDSTPQNVIVKAGELATVTFENAQLSSVRIRKIDAVTREPIGGVRFLIKDEHNNVIGEYTTDSDGYIELEDDLEEGKYYAEEIQAAPGYIRDEEVKTFHVRRGETTEIVWENTPQQGQIQITKKSKDDNPINGLPAGTLLQGATFEIYDKAGNVVDTIVSNERGVAISELLPLGRYTIRETKSPQYYGASGETFEAEIEFSGQIVRLEVLNESVYTNVSIVKSGPKQVVPGQPIRWTVSHIANNSTVPLQSFYWRDTLPYQAVTLDKIVTGTYNARLSYKIVYRTNLNRDYRTLADNLSTAQNRTIQANPTALGLKSGEVVTDFMFVFGNVPAGFRCVETPYVYGNVRSSVAGTAFVNKADVGGLHNQQWIMSNDAWTTDIYRVTKPTLPQTGW